MTGPFNKVMGVAPRLIWPFWWKTEIEGALYQKRHCWFKLKGTKKQQCNEGKLWDFLSSTGSDCRFAQW